MWGENGQVNGNGQPMYLPDAYFNPLTNSWSKPTAWSITGLLRAPLHAAVLCRSGGLVRRQLQWSNMGGGCNVFGFGCGVAQFMQRAAVAACEQLDHRRRHRLEPGHQPQLRPGADVSGHDPEPAERVHRHVGHQHLDLHPGRLERHSERFRRPLPHHPLLLILNPIGRTTDPRSESSGVFYDPPEEPLSRRAWRESHRLGSVRNVVQSGESSVSISANATACRPRRQQFSMPKTLNLPRSMHIDTAPLSTSAPLMSVA